MLAFKVTPTGLEEGAKTKVNPPSPVESDAIHQELIQLLISLANLSDRVRAEVITHVCGKWNH